MRAGLLLAGLLLVLSAASAAASNSRPTLAQVEHEVMCPTCHTLLELSHAPIADRMRAFIRRRIEAGDTDAEIKRRLVAEFGVGVLAAPPAHGFGLVAWVLPAGGFLVAGAIVAAILRRWNREQALQRAPDAGGTELDPALARMLDRELAEFDA